MGQALAMRAARLLAVIPLLAMPATGYAADSAPAFTLSGGAALQSDYRRRGVSFSDAGPALSADFDIEHRSGAHLGLAAATVSGWGNAGGSDFVVDLVAGWRLPAAGGDIDAGMRATLFPAGLPHSDFVELYGRFSGTIGPLFLRGGIAWAPPQRALGRAFDDFAGFVTGTASPRLGDNLYLEADASAFVPGTPVTLHAHVGHSRGNSGHSRGNSGLGRGNSGHCRGNSGLGPAGFSLAPTGEYWDWRVGADVVAGPVTLGLAFVDTDIEAGSAAARRLQPRFGRTRDGGAIAGATIVLSLSAAF